MKATFTPSHICSLVAKRSKRMNQGTILPPAPASWIHLSGDHDKLPVTWHASTSHIDHIRPWLCNIPVWRHRGGQFLTRSTSHVSSGIKEQHAVIHMQAVRHKASVIQYHRASRVSARGSECDGEVASVCFEGGGGEDDICWAGRIVLFI